MTVTLYRNTQTAGDKPDDVYTDRWELSTYKAPTLFHEGKTTGRAEFVIPPGYTIRENHFFKDGRAICIIVTGSDGRLRIKAKNYPDPGVPLSRVSEPKEEKKEEENLSAGTAETLNYIPQIKNGEWEIW
jgi:hypothetical protein